MAYASDIRTANAGFADRFHALTKAVSHALAQRKEYRRVYNELTALSARDLADLGISCTEIPYIARESANRV